MQNLTNKHTKIAITTNNNNNLFYVWISVNEYKTYLLLIHLFKSNNSTSINPFSHGDGLSYPTATDQTGNQRYDAMGNTSTNPNRLEVQPTDKLIDAIPLNNHQPHLELDNGQQIPSSQVIVNIEQTVPLPLSAEAPATNTSNGGGLVIDIIGDQSAKDASVLNGGPHLANGAADKIV